jgi:DNA polymerase-3 subunit gamma/tau
MADTVHDGLTEMRGTTAPRLLLELVCARMLLPETDGSAVATLQRLERLERRMSIAGEHAGRPAAEAAPPSAAREVPVHEAPVRESARPAPGAAPAAAPGPPAAPAQPAAARGYVRPSQRGATPAPAPAPVPAAASAPAADDWPETVPPGSGAGRSAAQKPAQKPAEQRPAARATTPEPDIPLPPEPTDDEDWPHPASPAATRAAAERTEAAAAGNGGTPGAAPPRAAAESSPVPRGGEPTPVVSANAAPADGELTTTDVRRVWPELLGVVKRHKRTTEALLKSAQVHGLAGGVLTLAATSPALAKMLGDDLNRDVLRQALLELLGVRWKVNVVVEGAAASSPAVAPEQAREAARAAESAEAAELMAERAADRSGGGDREPEPAVDPEQAALSLLRAQLGARPVDS